MLTKRKKSGPVTPAPWAVRTPAELRDRDGWRIVKGARVCARSRGHRWTGKVLDTYLDHRGREVVELLVGTERRSFRPGSCRLQAKRPGRLRGPSEPR